jgi:hypothetical protein
MPGPRADFECVGCAAVHPDLPVSSKFCPECGAELSRLFNAVNVSTRGHDQAKLVDPTIEPMVAERAAVQARARANEAMRPTALPAAAPFQSLDPAAKAGARTTAFPLLAAAPKTARLLQTRPDTPFFGPPQPRWYRRGD